jgi:Flp pilus assembly protein TadG
VFPFFMIILFFVIEFSFALNAFLAIDFASREGALAAAEAGNDDNADCFILTAVQRSVGAPANQANIQQVRIFKSTPAGDPVGPVTIYDRAGSTPCPQLDGSTLQVPFRRVQNNYPPTARCKYPL